MKFLSNMKIRVKLLAGFIIVAALILAVAVVSFINLQNLNKETSDMYTYKTLPIQQMDNVQANLMTARGDIMKYMLIAEQRTDIEKSIKTDKTAIDSSLAEFEKSNLSNEGKETVESLKSSLDTFFTSLDEAMTSVDNGDTESAMASISTGGKTSDARLAASEQVAKIISSNTDAAKKALADSQQMYESALKLMIIFVVICFIIAIGLGLSISNNIIAPVKVVVTALADMAGGSMVRDMSQTTKDIVLLRKDELGEIGRSMHSLVGYLQAMSNLAETIASNDLSLTVKPKSEKDELGNSFEKMIAGLQDTVGVINQTTSELSVASAQMAEAATQSSLATNQISNTIQQVAKGTADQASSVNKTASSMEQMSKAIDGVAKGAQEQSMAISKAAEITAQMSTAIQQVTESVASVNKDSDASAEAARTGAATVEETLKGMQSIKSKVDISAGKVQEMGQRSGEIGAIVETIEDIASQTNLLALNAAIEAARAGEHGKGFAVVADEVRKLAERSSQATKEIGSLIAGIQSTVAEAVKAMDEGSKEVELGVISANKAGAALSEIIKSAQAVNDQAGMAAKAAREMSQSSSELVASVDSVSAIVEENTAATEQMTANSTEVTQAVESIASVSEENSAAIEEVSASAEEMTAQVEEVSASAQSLADLARTLQEVANRFKLAAA
jgi:methyl-accepting chemotaxis protein